MKLLDKKKISTDIAAQKRAQIDEGIKIAQKVDKLRETLASLEAQHSKFIEASVKELQERTRSLQALVESKEANIARLEAKREALLKPLDEEWEKIELEKAQIAILQEETREKKLNASREEQLYLKLSEKAKDALEIALARKKQAEKACADAAIIEARAKATEQNALKLEKQVTEELATKKNMLLRLEREVEARESQLAIRDASLTEREEEIIKEKQHIASQQASLRSAMELIKARR